MRNDSNSANITDVKHEQQWEEGLYQEIVQYLDNPGEPFFCRFHFLCTQRGKIYVLDRNKWWHSIGGEASKVQKRLLRQKSFHPDRVNVQKSTRGWIPYFARTRSEERGIGWNEKDLVINAGDKNLQRRARKAQKAYHEWVSDDRMARR
jgi:hypothetical protein